MRDAVVLLQVLPGCLLLHFAAADLQEGQGDIDAARQVYQDLLPSLNPEEPPTMPSPEVIDHAASPCHVCHCASASMQGFWRQLIGLTIKAAAGCSVGPDSTSNASL